MATIVRFLKPSLAAGVIYRKGEQARFGSGLADMLVESRVVEVVTLKGATSNGQKARRKTRAKKPDGEGGNGG